MNLKYLKSLIKARGGIRAFAKKLDWHRNRAQALCRGKFEPDRTELVKIARALRLSQDEFTEIFFPELLDERCRYWAAS